MAVSNQAETSLSFSNSSAFATTDNNGQWNKILLASLAIIFILMTVMSFSYGLSGDEVDMNEFGKAILKYFTSFGADKTVFKSSDELNQMHVYNWNRDDVLKYYGGFFDLVCAVLTKISPLAEYTTRHMLNAWAGFLSIFFAAKIAAKLFNKQAAVLCAWMMFFSPFFLGHAMNNPKDIPFATAYIASIYCTLVFFQNLPKPAIRHYIFLILSIGITIDIRVAGILLLPYQFILAGLLFVFKSKSGLEKLDLKVFIKPLLIVCVGGYLAGSLFWPYAQQNPISNPLNALHEMSNFKVSIAQLYEGTKIPSSELPSDFLIKSFIMTNPYVVLIGLLTCFIFILKGFKRANAALYLFIIFTGLFPIFYIMYSHANVYHAWRHELFVFPSLAIAAAGGWYFLGEFLESRKFKWGLAVAGVLMLEPASFIVASYPNTVCYFNGVVGGPKQAYGNYEVDYYYNSVKQDCDWIKKNVIPGLKPTDTITIGSNCAHLLIPYFAEYKNVRILYVRYMERCQKSWDYSVFHIALIPEEILKSRCWINKNTLFKAELNGCPLSSVSKRASYDDLKGFEALKAQKVDTAIMYFENFLKADPDNDEMLSMMANIYHQLHQDNIAQHYNARLGKLMSVNNAE